jgi:hypothetical protein
MSFVLKQSATYTWPITLVLPVDGGRREKATFDAELRRLPQSRINEIVKLARRMDTGLAEDGEELLDQDAVREVMIGWDGVTDDKGQPIPFSEAALAQLIEIPTVAAQIIRAWFESIEVAKRKN